MFGGMKIVVEQNWPRDHIADAVYPYRGHPFWQWLWARFGRQFPVTMERGIKIECEIDPMIAGGHTIICSPRQYQELKSSFVSQELKRSLS